MFHVNSKKIAIFILGISIFLSSTQATALTAEKAAYGVGYVGLAGVGAACTTMSFFPSKNKKEVVIKLILFSSGVYAFYGGITGVLRTWRGQELVIKNVSEDSPIEVESNVVAKKVIN